MPDHEAPLIVTEPEYMAKVKRVAALLDDPNFMESICEKIANGDSLIRIAKDLDLKFTDILKWIRTNADRSSRYNAALNDRNEYVIESTLNMLQDASQFDVRRLYRNDGSQKAPHEFDDQTARAVVGIKPTEWGNEIKLADKMKAAEMIAKHHGLFIERHEVKAEMSLIDIITRSHTEGEHELFERRRIREASPVRDRQGEQSHDGQTDIPVRESTGDHEQVSNHDVEGLHEGHSEAGLTGHDGRSSENDGTHSQSDGRQSAEHMAGKPKPVSPWPGFKQSQPLGFALEAVHDSDRETGDGEI